MDEAYDSEKFNEVWSRVTGDTPESSGDPGEKELAGLRGFMDGEYSDSMFYKKLASCLSGREAKRFFAGLAADEHCHFKKLQTAYFLMTGDTYMPENKNVQITSILTALYTRFKEETEGAEAYAAAAGNTENARLKCLYTAFSADEARHACGIEKLIEGMV